MAFDGIFLHAIKNEISPLLIDTRIEKIHQPTRDEIVITFRGRQGSQKLLLSAKADCPRVQLTKFAPDNPAKPPMICMLDIVQDGLERILTFVFEATDELGDKVKYKVIIEIMARHSNIILVDGNNKIVDAVKRIDESKSSFRQLLPGLEYSLPPQQEKLNILTDDIDEIKSRIALCEKKLSKSVQEVVQGVSPIVCREVEYGISIDELKRNAQNPKPYVIVEDKPKDFCFMPINQYGSLVQNQEYDSFSDLLDFYYYQRERADRVKQRSADLYKQLNIFLDRAIRKIELRKNELEDCKDKEKYKVFGDLINSNLYALQKGMCFYEVVNYYDNNEIVKINANPQLTPSQNAQKYYKEYRKKQIAESKLNAFIEDAEREKDYLDSVIESLLRAENEKDVAEIKFELAESGFINKKKTKNQSVKISKPIEYQSTDGTTIFSGRNNKENDKLTLKTAHSNDMWFHVKDFPGSHTVAFCGGEISDETIKEAAEIAAFNSKCSSSSNVAVDYTLIKYVKKPSGAMPGRVIYTNYSTIYVTPELDKIEELKKSWKMLQ